MRSEFQKLKKKLESLLRVIALAICKAACKGEDGFSFGFRFNKATQSRQRTFTLYCLSSIESVHLAPNCILRKAKYYHFTSSMTGVAGFCMGEAHPRRNSLGFSPCSPSRQHATFDCLGSYDVCGKQEVTSYSKQKLPDKQ